MHIGVVARQSGVPTKTIRYYEQIGILPRPMRANNNYRHYHPKILERLRFIASARSLGFSLADVAEILAARDQGIAPCDRVLMVLDEQLATINHRIADLLALRDHLRAIRDEGAQRPRDDIAGTACVCALVKQYRANGTDTSSSEETTNV